MGIDPVEKRGSVEYTGDYLKGYSCREFIYCGFFGDCLMLILEADRQTGVHSTSSFAIPFWGSRLTRTCGFWGQGAQLGWVLLKAGKTWEKLALPTADLCEKANPILGVEHKYPKPIVMGVGSSWLPQNDQGPQAATENKEKPNSLLGSSNKAKRRSGEAAKRRSGEAEPWLGQDPKHRVAKAVCPAHLGDVKTWSF